jgi:5-methyltetrahydrofolate--homocysteine methyltransferase
MASDDDYGSLDFSAARWDKVQREAAAWWRGELKRPLIQVRVKGRQSPRAAAALPYQHYTITQRDAVAEQIVDSWDAELAQWYFRGDAFPQVWLNYGPGVVAALLGCRADVGRADAMTVWFHPEEVVEVEGLKFAAPEVSYANKLWRQMSELARAAQQQWQGKVQVGLTDFGGALDILSSFRPAEALLYDLADAPERVVELTWEIHQRWWDFYDRQDTLWRGAGNRGTTCWTPLFCSGRYYMLQCDFKYMLGPKQFAKFVAPELRASCQKLDQAFYHLDGVGQLASLDLLLAIPELKGVQWIPGSGQRDMRHWPEVYRKIAAAGKKIQIGGSGLDGMEQLEIIADQIGRADNIVTLIDAETAAELPRVEKFLAQWGAL